MANNNDSTKELVTVVCRSTGRPELKQALRSIHSQTYSSIEILLINAGGIVLAEQEETCSPIPLKLIDYGRKLSRPQAANAGLENATGRFITFLDEDDWIEEDHIETLVNALTDNPNFKATYTNVQKATKDGVSKNFTFSTAFDPILLMRDNYIPIHAMLFERSLLSKGCRFDENFEIYEDWDFWLQLNQHTEFYHNNIITAYYRDGGESETAAIDPVERFSENTKIGKARSALFAKWMKRWSGEDLNKMLGQLNDSLQSSIDDLEKAIHQRNISDQSFSEARKDLAEEHKVNLNHQSEIRELLLNLEKAIHERNISAQKTEELDGQIETLHSHISALEQHLAELKSSKSWRVTRPLRRVARTLRKLFIFFKTKSN